MVSGAVLLLFLVVHISQVNGWLAFAGASSVYENLQAGFERWPVVALYLLAQLALAFHLYHGLWSACQTLGVRQLAMLLFDQIPPQRNHGENADQAPAHCKQRDLPQRGVHIPIAPEIYEPVLAELEDLDIRFQDDIS